MGDFVRDLEAQLERVANACDVLGRYGDSAKGNRILHATGQFLRTASFPELSRGLPWLHAIMLESKDSRLPLDHLSHDVEYLLYSISDQLQSEPHRVSELGDIESEADISLIEQLAESCLSGQNKSSTYIKYGLSYSPPTPSTPRLRPDYRDIVRIASGIRPSVHDEFVDGDWDTLVSADRAREVLYEMRPVVSATLSALTAVAAARSLGATLTFTAMCGRLADALLAAAGCIVPNAPSRRTMKTIAAALHCEAWMGVFVAEKSRGKEMGPDQYWAPVLSK